jgi:YidC/Oxa1 family membrane protein insertase
MVSTCVYAHCHSSTRVDGVPSLGWHDTVAFLSIPVFLTISQIISMNLMQPKSDDPQQQQANVILKVLPFMVGWFALNVPAALGVYWVVNNVVTTASTLYVRSIMPKIEPVTGGGGGGAAASSSVMESTRFNPTPMNERAAGFGRASSDSGDMMKTITPIDAEIVEDFDDGADEDMGPDIPAAPTGKVSYENPSPMYSISCRASDQLN